MKTIKLHQRHILGIVMVLGVGFCVPQHWLTSITTTASAQQSQKLKQTVIRREDGDGDPQIRLRQSFDLPIDPTIQQMTAAGNAEPVALAAGDFDEDGVPDLITGYRSLGRGVLTLHRGSSDTLDTRSLSPQHAADGAASRSPFLPAEHAFELAASPDFIGTGDFDANGHLDVAVATRGEAALYLLPGDGRGGFGQAERIALPGQVTALISGEVNRADGLDDLIVGINDMRADAGASVLIFESPEGALRSKPEVFGLPDVASALALGQLDDDWQADLAIAAGSELLIVHGRDRRLSLDETQQAKVHEAVIERQSFPSAITGLALGDFVWETEHRTEIAIKSAAGNLQVLERPTGESGKSGWRVVTESLGVSGSLLIGGHVSGSPTDDLIVADGASRQLRVLKSEGGGESGWQTTARVSHVAASLEIERSPVAVLPLRRNGEALQDLIVLRQGQAAPTRVLAVAASQFEVNSLADSDDGSCDPLNGSADCTLREAIIAANHHLGLDTIVFDLPGTGVTQPTINLTSPLPTIIDPVTINGNVTGQLGIQFRVQLNGLNAGREADGLKITAGSSTITRMVINRFSGDGIELAVNGGNVIQDCRIGTDPGGNNDLGNGTSLVGNGIFINGSSNNTIGGTTTTARNIISGNDRAGVWIAVSGTGSNQSPANGNKVQGNYIGTNTAGTGALGNTQDGVVISGGSGNLVGGITNTQGAGAPPGNIISSNGTSFGVSGVVIVYTFLLPSVVVESSDNLVQGNLIGTNANGTGALGNGTGVVLIGLTKRNTIGGTLANKRNIISGNLSSGVYFNTSDFFGEDNQVQGNFIGTDKTGTADLGNGGQGVDIQGRRDETIGGTASGARNVISGNGLNGILIEASVSEPAIAAEVGVTTNATVTIPSSDIRVQGNLIGTDVNGTSSLGNGLHGISIDGSSNNTIGGTTSTARNLISGNGAVGSGSGIFLQDATGNLVQGNFIGTNINGTVALKNNGHGISLNEANGNVIGGTTAGARNVVSGNGFSGLTFGNAFDNVVQGNFIGTDVTGAGPLGNTQVGVLLIAGSSNNTIGGTASGAGNTIAFNGAGPVEIINGTGNAVRGNSIFSSVGIGIDLNNDTITPNDPGDTDGGANLSQNFPILNVASNTGSSIIISGTLNSASTTTFALDFYANASCLHEGKIFLGSTTVTTNGSGNGTFTVTLPVAVSAGQFITATATDPQGNTSEFSACKVVTQAALGNLTSPRSSSSLLTLARAFAATRSTKLGFSWM